MFYKDMQEKKGLKAAPVSQTSDIISREWKKVKWEKKEDEHVQWPLQCIKTTMWRGFAEILRI